LESEQDFIEMNAKGVSETIYLFFIPLIGVFPPKMLIMAKAILHKVGLFSPSGTTSHGLTPLMLSTETYKILEIEVDHLYLPTHVPSCLPHTRELFTLYNNQHQHLNRIYWG
jgi:hypothetical protein